MRKGRRRRDGEGEEVGIEGGYPVSMSSAVQGSSSLCYRRTVQSAAKRLTHTQLSLTESTFGSEITFLYHKRENGF